MSSSNTMNAKDLNHEDMQFDKTDNLIKSSICSNCANQEDCGILEGSLTSILQCEMYECCSLPKPELVGKSKAIKTVFVEQEKVHLLGLCSNCDNRAECRLPKASAGNWHCEEYC